MHKKKINGKNSKIRVNILNSTDIFLNYFG